MATLLFPPLLSNISAPSTPPTPSSSPTSTAPRVHRFNELMAAVSQLLGKREVLLQDAYVALAERLLNQLVSLEPSAPHKRMARCVDARPVDAQVVNLQALAALVDLHHAVTTAPHPGRVNARARRRRRE